MQFKDMPKTREFRTEREARFKENDGLSDMAFSERVKIQIEITKVRNMSTKEELEKLMDETMEKAKEIIATHEALR